MSSLLMLVSASGLLAAALKSAAVVLLAAVVAALLGRASAAWRHLTWCLSVASLLLLPLLSVALPDWRVAWLPPLTAQPAQLVATRQSDLAQTNRTQPFDNAAIALPPATGPLQIEPHKEPHNPPPAVIETASPPRSAIPWLAIAWPAGGFLALVPLAVGLWQLAGLRRRSQVIGDPRWLTLLDELRRQLAVRRRVQLRQGESTLAPLTWGALRPVLLVPCEAGAWPHERRRLVLLHELAHVRRWDWLTQLLAHVACAVYWFNPLVWLAARQMRIERERACDDVVLASGARASDYARELLALAAALSPSHTSMPVVVPMARRRELEVRLRGILDSRRSRSALTRGAVCLLAALAAAAMIPLAMLEAAPPESPPLQTAEPKQSPPLIDLGTVGRQEKEVAGVHAPPFALSDPEAKETWNLTMEEALQSALANSKVVQNLGGVLFMPAGPQSDLKHVASQGAKGSVQDPKAAREAKVRFVLARTNEDVALADFESGVRNLVSDVERAYWDLYYNYRNLAAVQAGRDSALETWRKVYALQEQKDKKGDAEKESQAREQYFLFRAQVENSLGLLYTAESRLRYIMGLAATDGRLIRPADEPVTAKLQFDFDEILREALSRSIELRRQRGIIKQNELKLQAARDRLPRQSDIKSLYTWRGFGDAPNNNKSPKTDPKPSERQENRTSSAGNNLKNDQYQEPQSGLELTVPIGFRLAIAGVRNAELALAQSRALLQDQELELEHVLTNAVRDFDRNYRVSQTTFNRRVAAARQVEAMKTSYDAGTITLDMLLDAQRRLSDAEIAYYRALVDYNIAILQIHYRKGSLSEHNGILLAEGPRAGFDVRKK